jgi:signal transduction histidine kinase/PAS domain-containing protein
MLIVESEFAQSRDPRLAAQLADHAAGASPAWLWSTDGSRILWANAVGAAIFGAANTNECATRRFEAKHPAVGEIARLAATLPPGGQARLERLRGFGARFGRTLTCICSCFPLANGAAAVLVIATEPAGPALTLRERVSRLFSDDAQPMAAFAPDGTFLAATKAAQTRFAGAPTFSALGIAGIATRALATGSASGATDHGAVTVQRLGSAASAVLVVTFGAESSGGHAAETAPAKIEPAPPAAAPQAPVEALPPSPPVEPVASAPAAPTTQPAPSPLHGEPITERRHPLRFVWQMDANGRFVVGSDEFTELMGPQTTAAFGRLWSEVAAELNLDPEHQVARVVATRETWSGIIVSWPVDEGGERLPVELSGLPVFDRERQFRGYRGFGVCRDIARINQLTHARRERPIGFMARPEAAPEREAAAEATPQSTASADTKAVANLPPASEAAAETEPRNERPTASGASAAANVVWFRPGTPEPKAPSLSPVERKAFRELAQELTARLRGGQETPIAEGGAVSLPAEEQAITVESTAAALAPLAPEILPPSVGGEAGRVAASSVAVPVEAHEAQPEPTAAAQAQAMPAEPALLDRIPVGVLIYQHDALLYANRHFLDLSGHQSLDALAAAGGLNTLVVEPGGALAMGGGAQSLSLVTGGGERCEVEGRLFTVPWGGASALALILTNGEAAQQRRATALSLSAAENEIRELAAKLEAAKKSEEELRGVTREAQKAAAAKADFLGKVSHEIRTPLNAITGFTEVIMAERFGPIGNERYREYLKDVHAAGMHLVALLNDLLDLSKIESGQLGLTFGNVSLNELTQQCVGIMQPQASRARIIIRTALAPALPQVVADERSLRQIVLNLLSNSIKFTGPGGQVIVSTAFADNGEAVLRVRDTGVGMSEKDVEAALEPFRQTATSGSWGSGGTGLGLPLTKALAEANRAHFSIKSAPNAGTLIEVAFPPTRVVAQ